MGYDLRRFSETVDEELICSICSGVLENPVEIIACEHTFCRACIERWLARSPTCPVDRAVCNSSSLRRVPRITRTLLSRLSINCDNGIYGCTQVCKLDELPSHLQVCEYKPNMIRSCMNGFPPVFDAIFEIALDLKNEIESLQRQWTIIRQILEKFDTMRWSKTLPRVRALRWDALISTPDGVLKTVLASGLAASACPTHLLQKLVANCHECNWPTGLNTVEIRQTNHRIMQNYTFHRVPGEQALIAFSCWNSHMSQEMMVKPGLVFMFSEGVE